MKTKGEVDLSTGKAGRLEALLERAKGWIPTQAARELSSFTKAYLARFGERPRETVARRTREKVPATKSRETRQAASVFFPELVAGTIFSCIAGEPAPEVDRLLAELQ